METGSCEGHTTDRTQASIQLVRRMDAQALDGQITDGKLKSSNILCTMAGKIVNDGVILQPCTGWL